jgi:copper homeostasis protein
MELWNYGTMEQWNNGTMEQWNNGTMEQRHILLEVCSGSLSSALAAKVGGAHRIELCDNLAEGGTTPSPGMIRQTLKLLDIPVFVLIRPRPGDFLYSDQEFQVMKDDVLFCKEHGAKGLVLGILKPGGTVDMERTAELVRLARPMQVTFHRAFDMTRDPFEALKDLANSGVNRILTSGQAASALEGAGLIKELIRMADSWIVIMPSGGINEENIRELFYKTNAVEFHASLRSSVKSRMQFRNERTFMGKAGEDEYTRLETDPERVRQFIEIMNELPLRDFV